jgi:hypothetical protein
MPGRTNQGIGIDKIETSAILDGRPLIAWSWCEMKVIRR